MILFTLYKKKVSREALILVFFKIYIYICTRKWAFPKWKICFHFIKNILPERFRVFSKNLISKVSFIKKNLHSQIKREQKTFEEKLRVTMNLYKYDAYNYHME